MIHQLYKKKCFFFKVKICFFDYFFHHGQNVVDCLLAKKHLISELYEKKYAKMKKRNNIEILKKCKKNYLK